MLLMNVLSGASLDVLDQNRMPWLSTPTYLRRVNSDARAKNYAAGGFHVAVTRGLAGGCGDPPVDLTASDNIKRPCQRALNSDEAKQAWADAAEAYYGAYFAVNVEGKSYKVAVPMLDAANKLADAAYAIESRLAGVVIEPPRDPGATPGAEPEPDPGPAPAASAPLVKGRPWGTYATVGAAAVGIPLLIWFLARGNKRDADKMHYDPTM